MKKVTVKLTFLEGVLGTSSADAEIYTRFIGAKAPDAATIKEEVEALGAESIVERGTTVFPRDDDGTPFLYDYQIKGFFKDACSMLSRLSEKDSTGKKKKAKNESGKLTAYKKVIDGLIFVEPRKIRLESPGPVTICQRPLRAQTAQGERVALSSSEELPAGTTVTMTIICMDDSHWAAVEEWLNYGIFRGIGQWRNSGKGRFAWEVLD